MPVTFGPSGGGAAGAASAAPSAGGGNAKAHPPGVKEILKTVTPNYVVTAVIKNRLEEGKIKAQKKKRRTRQEILASMDLRELQVCRVLQQQSIFCDDEDDSVRRYRLAQISPNMSRMHAYIQHFTTLSTIPLRLLQVQHIVNALVSLGYGLDPFQCTFISKSLGY